MSDEKCAKCGLPRSSNRAGSITQWISVCNCDYQGPGSEPNTAVTLCGQCGKRVASRMGSLTQWIFRDDACNCGLSTVNISPSSDLTSSQDVEPAFEVELALDPDLFPQDRYKALAEIGIGASGVVYLCRDRILKKRVAIKCLRKITAEQLIGFQREAKATSQLRHPAVVQVMDFGSTESGAPYMVMEYVKGTSLEEEVRKNGPLALETALCVFSAIAQGLGHAHNKGIFHRDVKSSNILLVGDLKKPDVRIIDFGVASIKHAIQETAGVQASTIVGTPAYMPADQARGLPYDERSEIYALGCVMFEALTGRPPFVGDTALEIIAKHATEPVPSLNALYPQIMFPAALEAIVSRCLAKEPTERYSSMERLAEDLANVVLKNDARLDSEPGPKPLRRFKKSWVVIASGLVLLGTFCSFGFWNWRYESRPETKRFDQPLSEGDFETQSKLGAAYTLLDSIDAREFRQHDLVEIRYGTDKQLKELKPARQVILINGDYTNAGYTSLNSSSIQELHLRSMSITKDDLLNFNIPTLTALRLFSCITDGGFLKNLTNSSIQELLFNDSNIKDESFRDLGAMKNLRLVVVAKCPLFTGSGWSYLSSSSVNEVCWFSDVKLVKRTDNDLNELPRLDKSREPYAMYSNDSLNRLSQIPHLTRLTLIPEAITPIGFQQIARLRSLEELHLVGRKSVPAGSLAKLSAAPALKKISFECPVTALTFKTLRTFPRLSSVATLQTQLDNDCMNELSKLKLEQLEISKSYLPPQALDCLSRMKTLKQLTFRGNPENLDVSKIELLKARLNPCKIEVLQRMSKYQFN